MSVPGPGAPEAAAAEALDAIDARTRKVLGQLHRAIAVSGWDSSGIPFR